VASSDISGYKKVFKNELVMGFPIDEGVLGFQKYYDAAAVSPAYKIFRLKREVNVEYLDLILRSNSLRKIYKSKMQGSVERRRSIPDEMFLNIEIPNPPEEVKDQIVKQHKLIKEIENSLKENQKKLRLKTEALWELPQNYN
ncbi:TPA: restriction endonuclease subunit M/S, partial [Acinetobacter baumannii]|nr:restriction endonuclease subunit M/S [Acinetobacter baumannii]EKX8032237.1 restriction endonuclease subunit M/S [Acinetobacter baumannii]EMF0871868.1 restriction endonuclease subunit M/S [Acinetobacter baumannii]HCT6736587.1 restriction endonuclease subunit M/S [Acinetobacter baumannii]